MRRSDGRGRDLLDRISLVRDFWNEVPCDGQQSYLARSRFRYRKDPWLIGVLERIASQHRNVLEIGCGQGTDGVTLCTLLREGSSYTGVDISSVSLTRARAAAAEFADKLRVSPVFRLDNAEQLGFPDNHFDCVLSVGALHHSPNTERAISEVKRVLAYGGSAFICLYRTFAPKVLCAHVLRGVQTCADGIFRTERLLYRAARRVTIGDEMGTAIYECFGVPILRSYRRRQMQVLFNGFTSVRLSAHGWRLPRPRVADARFDLENNPLGYLWLAEARK